MSTIIDIVRDGQDLKFGLGTTLVEPKNLRRKMSLANNPSIIHKKDQLITTPKTTESAGMCNSKLFVKFVHTIRYCI